jgi:hypothetical protein
MMNRKSIVEHYGAPAPAVVALGFVQCPRPPLPVFWGSGLWGLREGQKEIDMFEGKKCFGRRLVCSDMQGSTVGSLVLRRPEDAEFL